MPETRATRKLLLFDIDEKDSNVLAEFGIAHTRDRSWMPGKRKIDGIKSLLTHSKVNIPKNARVEEHMYRGTVGPCSAEKYFAGLADEINNAIEASRDKSPVVVLNLMPLCLCRTRVDRIVRGLFDSTRFADLTIDLVLLLRNVDWMAKSSAFQKIRDYRRLRMSTTVIDARGFVSLFVGDNTETFEISRGPFKEILSCSEQHVYRSLIFETNSYLGHFILRNSHARTHYDLGDFIRRDDVWEYLIGVFSAHIRDVKSVLIVGVGMESGVINIIGAQLKLLLGDHCEPVEFMYLPAPDEAPASNWSERFEMAIIVTDIINSGGTVLGAARKLREGNLSNRPIKIFTIASMLNSPPDANGIEIIPALRIRREYYQPDPARCPLCQINQPATEVSRVRDFSAVHPQQLTPFDFWEIATDSKALERLRPDPQGRSLRFRVETTQMIQRYWAWLRNVVIAKFRENWPNDRPDVVCTVDEPGGKAFSQLVGDAVGVSTILSVKRADLNRITPSGPLPDKEFEEVLRRATVLIVDDGMNFGQTMKRLITFCRVAKATVIGGLVLDSRIGEDELKSIRSLMSNNKILSLYSWPATSNRL